MSQLLDAINVTTLTGYIHNIFVQEEMLHDLRVCGEVSGYGEKGLHSYFMLKDENAQINCCCFNCAKTYIPKNGDSVVLVGDVDFYSKQGKLNFNVSKITPFGAGLLAIQLEQLKRKLIAQGYFDEERKQAIPPYPKRVCVITSKSGAVIKDIITTIRKQNDTIDITICDVRVQGKDCASDVINALKIVDKLAYDVIIIARGGGSMEDLMPFNDEKLVIAIAGAITPIISAVGHETDTTLCDYAADLRVATPTAAAARVGYNQNDFVAWIKQSENSLRTNIERLINDKLLLLKLQKEKLTSSFANEYSKLEHNLELLQQKLNTGVNNVVQQKDNKLKFLLSKLDANNPVRLMQKGFFEIKKDNCIVTEIKSLKQNDEIEIVGCDGKAKAQIIEVIV